MLRTIIIILTVHVLTSCNSSQDKTPSAKDRTELIPEPDKDLREKYETHQNLKEGNCIFSNPDTSLSKIKLRNPESTIKIIGNNDKADDNGQYHYYSTMYRETLTLTQHPGDGKYQISIFKVKLSDKADYGYRKLNIDTFQTEKGLKLGMNKEQITRKLGKCYVAKDSVKGYIELYYRLEIPNDSQTKLLKRNNTPAYYAPYKLWKNKLEEFEFGFEYP